ncbi:hypothetical protein TraAM80_09008 [Trypanosoma rangeli]|uniref:Uncharacterized protein n=1 Tax=Trypanosoma rangeli TaxID=5698 RepID=A0A422MXZ3_TRYRA|nr:uncharacterized protein TraAM80_09008 [Trypanosoma rangeli]RNE98040.1 hypothetical protein TraAM80_09008 [Trypanosoma rangeli]|eukprot:RNE98040.1 hypothetical protein TraAM80_09008 [Trypanosoma rangeli]
MDVVGNTSSFPPGGNAPDASSAGNETDWQRKMSPMATAAGEKGEPSLYSCGADALPPGLSVMPSSVATSLAPHAALDACVEAFRVYTSAALVLPEEKAVILSMLDAVAKYTQARLRTQKIFHECEACLHQAAQLQTSISAAAVAFASSTLSNVTDNFVFQSPLPAVGFTSSTANLQRGRAKVDTDLAECRRMLQQVEAFARAFQDLQRRRARLLEGLEDEKQRQLPPPSPQCHDVAHMPLAAPPVSQLHATLEDCISQLHTQWETHVTATANSFVCRLHGTRPQESGEVLDSNEGELVDNVRLLMSLLQVCDNTLGRVDTMRSRISRLGSSRIEEAEALEKLLANMDHYDPTAEEHAGRRKQIDAELEELRSWLTHIGQLRQRAMSTAELLQQFLLNENREAAGSGRTSSCLPLPSEGGSAPSSHRPSLGGPASLDEWRQALIAPDTAAAKETGRHAADATAASGDASASAATDPAAPALTPADIACKNEYPTSAVPTAAEGVSNAEDNSGSVALPGPPRSAAAVAEDCNTNTVPEGKCRHGPAGLQPAPGDASGDDDGDDDATSSYHASAFDENDSRGHVESGARCRRRRKRPAAAGYLGGIAAFARAVVQRATRFSDSEYSSASDCESETEGRRRRRLE